MGSSDSKRVRRRGKQVILRCDQKGGGKPRVWAATGRKCIKGRVVRSTMKRPQSGPRALVIQVTLVTLTVEGSWDKDWGGKSRESGEKMEERN